MYKIPANTLFVGKNLVFVPHCPSTNTLAFQISQQPPVNEGTVVITDHQTAGKGQRGNTWEAEPRQNLTFSLILKPNFLAINKQFYLNVLVCLAIKDYLEEKRSGAVYIKWPNDILVHEKKISGVLIENQLQGSIISQSIVGVGININQNNFLSPGATSLSNVSGDQFDLAEELPAILSFIEARYLQLRKGEYEILMDLYLANLYRRRAKHTFITDGQTFEGEIEGVDEWGKLLVRVDGAMKAFGMKEVRFGG